jgi:polyisoprenoid-binding protein YceI
MTTQTKQRLHDLVGTWTIDATHSSFEFVVKHMMISKVRGAFNEFEGSFTIAPDVSKSSVDVVVKTASLDTNQADRDAHLRSADFFEVEKYPELIFSATGAELLSDDRAHVTGDLTIKGLTRPVGLDVVFNDLIEKDMYGLKRASFTATTRINREDWGLTWNAPLETGGVLVARDVGLELEIAATQDAG